ncbi:ROK family protein [Sphingomonas glaciei]|uniref:fructokinase n=1 Tax=Sphingomonas glaciei TaxID=2938948 RepID=A0ABY5MYE5_9SPHN|nr:ROK family protein [Sphingomonas glaciei]UUR08118.1 ROK family protein [Sphingomonas glaciei]
MSTAATAAGERGLPLAGVELGGTKCVCILAHGPSEILAQVTLPTGERDATLASIRATLDGWRFAALGIASFGPLDLARGCIGNTPKPGWSGADLTTLGAGVPTVIDTDVNGASLAEGRWGAARGLASWAYVTVGTGIGVGSIVAGRPVTGLGHSEAGHLRVPRSDPTWPGACRFHGDCVEGLASGPAIAARTGRRGETLPPDHPVWAEVAEALAGLCHNLALTSLPERILVGGGVVTGRPELLTLVRARLAASLAGYGASAGLDLDNYLITPALGPLAGPLGAIALAWPAGDPIG